MNKVVHTFRKGNDHKVKAIARLELELVYNDIAAEYVSHYVTRTENFISSKVNIYIYIYI